MLLNFCLLFKNRSDLFSLFLFLNTLKMPLNKATKLYYIAQSMGVIYFICRIQSVKRGLNIILRLL